MFRIILIVVYTTLMTLDVNAQVARKDKFGYVEIIGEHGELLEYHLLDDNGNFRPPPRLAKKIYQYDSLNNLILEKYCQVNGKLYQYPSGVAMFKYVHFNPNEFLIESYDSAGSRTIDKEIGASIIYYKYDSQKRIREMIYFNKDSTRINNNEGYSRSEFLYDPFILVNYYDYNEILIRSVDEDIKYMSGLQLHWASIPGWLRKAKQSNRVDGVNFKSFQYDLTLYSQTYDGIIEFSIEISKENIDNVRLLNSENVSSQRSQKTMKALEKAYFISLSNLSSRPISGLVLVKFSMLSP